MKLTYTSEQFDKAYTFSENSNIEAYVKRYKQAPKEARRKILIGKVGEFSIYNLLAGFTNNLTEPDTTIYDNPTFNPDLIFENREICIKTQEITSTKQYASWVFKNNEIPTLTNKIIAGCFYEAGQVRLRLFLEYEDIQAGLGKPIAESFRYEHTALYPHWLQKTIDESLFYS